MVLNWRYTIVDVIIWNFWFHAGKMGALCCKKKENGKADKNDEEVSITKETVSQMPVKFEEEIHDMANNTSIERQPEEDEEFILDCDSLVSLKRQVKDANESGLSIVVVEFYNINACNISEEIRPELEEMAKEFSDKKALVLFMRIDGKQPGVGWTYNLSGFPTYIIFRNGKEVERMIGPQVDVEFIKNKVQKQLIKRK